MIAWSIEAANASIYLDRTIVSSDDREIIAVATEWNADIPFTRPAELGRDDSLIYDVLTHALDSIDRSYDMVVLLQATSPLRTAGDIDDCIETCVKLNASSCVSITPADKSPYHYFNRDGTGRIHPFASADGPLVNRQDLPQHFTVNGAVYVAKSDWLRTQKSFFGNDTVGHVMPRERSVDVDSEMDIVLARAMLLQSMFKT